MILLRVAISSFRKPIGFGKINIGLLRSPSLLVLAFCLVTNIFGQDRSPIRGRVVDGNGHAVAGAVIKLDRSDIRSQLETVASYDGSFEFAEVLAGNYLLTAISATFGKKVVALRAPASESISLTLEPETVAAEISINASTLTGGEGIERTPGTVDHIDNQFLTSSRLFNFSEVLRKISGVNVRDEEGFGLRPNIGIRGTNPTRSTKVLLLEDGIPLAYAPYGDNASYYHPPIERYEAIEVQKGSGQIAFGPQTVAGLINYITPNPTELPSFGIKLIGGNRAFFNGSLTGSGTIGTTGIFANLTHKRGDGARENINSKLNDLFTKVVQTLNPSNALTFKFSYYSEDSNVTYSGLTEAEFAANPRANPFRNDFFYGDRFGFSASHTGVFSSNAFLTTSFYANNFTRHWWRQSSNSSQRPNRLNVDPDCLSMAYLDTTCGIEGRLRQYETFGVEPKLTLDYGSSRSFRGELHSGFRMHWETQDRRQENGDLPASRSGVPVEINIRRNLAVSGFIQNRFVFGDFSITPGVRFERINIQRENHLVSPIATGETTVDAFVPGFSIAYTRLPRTTIYTGVHRGFSPPRAEDIISNAGGVVELDPEESWNYELGVRSEPIRGMQLSGAFFRLDYENQIIPASLAGGVGAALTNGGETLQQGMEFTGQFDSGQFFRSNHNVYLRTALTWLSTAEFRGVRFSSIVPAVSISGNRLPYTPKTLVTSSVGYSHPSGFDAFVEHVYVGDQFSDDLNTIAPIANGQRGFIDAQSYWNATINYRVEKWRTTFFATGKNLLDRIYIIDRSRGILPSGPRLIQAGVHIRL